MKKAPENTLSLEHLQLLVKAMPQFVQLQYATISGLKKVADGAKASQRDAFHAVGHSLDSSLRVLEVLSRVAQTDETRLQIALAAVEVGRQVIEVAKIVERMNSSNNKTWRWIAGIAGTAVVAGAGIALAVFANSRDKKS